MIPVTAATIVIGNQALSLLPDTDSDHHMINTKETNVENFERSHKGEDQRCSMELQ